MVKPLGSSTFAQVTDVTSLTTTASRNSAIVNNSTGVADNATDISTLSDKIDSIPAGATGASAKSIAESIMGRSLTDAEFIDSLKGADGISGLDGSNGSDGQSAFTIWKSVRGYDESATEDDFISDIKGNDYKENIITKKKNKLKKSVKVAKKTINNTQYLTIKNKKGKVSAVAIPHDVIIGTSSTKSDLHLSGDAIVDGDIQLSGDIGHFSDERLKEDIKKLDNTIEIIKNITPVSFMWKTSGKTEVGFIAQNIQEIVPELVMKDTTTGFLKLKTTTPTWNALIISTIKEQQEMIEEQQLQIDELKKMILEITKLDT